MTVSNVVTDQNDWIFPVKEKFKLSEKFLDQYKDKQPNWGPLGYITYKRSYARVIEEENRYEEFWESLKRIVEGCYTIQLNHCKNLRLPWNAHKSQKSAQIMFDKMWNFKFLPPGRMMWALGTDVVWKKGAASLLNCAMCSTEDLNYDFSGPFSWVMDMSLFGVGCGFDTLGAGKVKIQEPRISESIHVIPDSKEGWVEAVRVMLDAYVGKDKLPMEFDYSKIRPAGSLIKTFGGIAPGPGPLIQCMKELKELLDKKIGEVFTSCDIVDTMNIIGKCVVSGGIRRVALLALGNGEDKEYLSMKDPNLYGDLLTKWRWASNNSVVSYEGMDYEELAKQTATNGEPGFVYLENLRKYGRLKDGITWRDKNVKGVNPCGEQSLENYELCLLCELFPSRHETQEEFMDTIKYAYLLAKSVTLIPTHCERSNQVMLRNRRIGLSLSGIVEAIEKFGRRNFLSNFCDKGYTRVRQLDEKYSNWLCIPESIKVTTVKPSGTVSLLPQSSPGIHYPHSEFYIRRIEIQKDSPLEKPLEKAGYRKEQSVYKDNSWVFEFPVKTENFKKSKDDVTIWEQMALHADIQYYWSDNNVSQTVTFSKDEAKDLKSVLETYEDKIKAVSFLPLSEHGYAQAPYESITEEEYLKRKSEIKKELDLSKIKVNIEEDIKQKEKNKFCDGDSCGL